MKRHRSWAIFAVLFAAAFSFALPASAAISLTSGDDVLTLHASPHDIGQDMRALIVTAGKAMHREAATFFNSGHAIKSGSRAERLPFGLSPEYAESYATDGLNFLHRPMRC